MKMAKKHFMSTQWQHEAISRRLKYENIMRAHDGDQRIFCRLIADQGKDGTQNTNQLNVNGEALLTSSNDISDGGQITLKTFQRQTTRTMHTPSR